MNSQVLNWHKIHQFVHGHTERIARDFFPGGTRVDDKHFPTKGLYIQLKGAKAGFYYDLRHNEQGRLIKLVARSRNTSEREVVEELERTYYENFHYLDPAPKICDKDLFVGRFIQYLEVERNASPCTVTAYRQAIEKFRKFFGKEVSWHACTATQFRAFLMDCAKSGMARSYVRLTFGALRSFYKYLVERCRLAKNPLTEVQLPKLEKKLPVVLSVTQMEELSNEPKDIKRQNQAPAWASARDTAVMELLYGSGLRLGELGALNVTDIDPYAET